MDKGEEAGITEDQEDIPTEWAEDDVSWDLDELIDNTVEDDYHVKSWLVGQLGTTQTILHKPVRRLLRRHRVWFHSEKGFVITVPFYEGGTDDKLELTVVCKGREIKQGKLNHKNLGGCEVTLPRRIYLAEMGITPLDKISVCIDGKQVIALDEKPVRYFVDGEMMRWGDTPDMAVISAGTTIVTYPEDVISATHRFGVNIITYDPESKINLRILDPSEKWPFVRSNKLGLAILPDNEGPMEWIRPFTEEEDPNGLRDRERKARFRKMMFEDLSVPHPPKMNFIRKCGIVFSKKGFFLAVNPYECHYSDDTSIRVSISAKSFYELPDPGSIRIGGCKLRFMQNIPLEELSISPLRSYGIYCGDEQLEFHYGTDIAFYNRVGGRVQVLCGEGFIVSKIGYDLKYPGVRYYESDTVMGCRITRVYVPLEVAIEQYRSIDSRLDVIRMEDLDGGRFKPLKPKKPEPRAVEEPPKEPVVEPKAEEPAPEPESDGIPEMESVPRKDLAEMDFEEFMSSGSNVAEARLIKALIRKNGDWVLRTHEPSYTVMLEPPSLRFEDGRFLLSFSGYECGRDDDPEILMIQGDRTVRFSNRPDRYPVSGCSVFGEFTVDFGHTGFDPFQGYKITFGDTVICDQEPVNVIYLDKRGVAGSKFRAVKALFLDEVLPYKHGKRMEYVEGDGYCIIEGSALDGAHFLNKDERFEPTEQARPEPIVKKVPEPKEIIKHREPAKEAEEPVHKIIPQSDRRFPEDSPELICRDGRYYVSIPPFIGNPDDPFEVVFVAESYSVPAGRLDKKTGGRTVRSRPVELDITMLGIAPMDRFTLTIDGIRVMENDTDYCMFDSDGHVTRKRSEAVTLAIRSSHVFYANGARVVSKQESYGVTTLGIDTCGTSAFKVVRPSEKGESRELESSGEDPVDIDEGITPGFKGISHPRMVFINGHCHIRMPAYIYRSTDPREVSIAYGGQLIDAGNLPADHPGRCSITSAVTFDLNNAGINPLEEFEVLLDGRQVYLNEPRTSMLFDSTGRRIGVQAEETVFVIAPGCRLDGRGYSVLDASECGFYKAVRVRIPQDSFVKVLRPGKEFEPVPETEPETEEADDLSIDIEEEVYDDEPDEAPDEGVRKDISEMDFDEFFGTDSEPEQDEDPQIADETEEWERNVYRGFRYGKPHLQFLEDRIVLFVPPYRAATTDPLELTVKQDGRKVVFESLMRSSWGATAESAATDIDVTAAGLDILEPFTVYIDGDTVFRSFASSLLTFDDTGNESRKHCGETLAVYRAKDVLRFSGGTFLDETESGDIKYTLLDMEEGGKIWIGKEAWTKEIEVGPWSPSSEETEESECQEDYGFKADSPMPERYSYHEFAGRKPFMRLDGERILFHIPPYIGTSSDPMQYTFVQGPNTVGPFKLEFKDHGTWRESVMCSPEPESLGIMPLDGFDLYIDGRSVYTNLRRMYFPFDYKGRILKFCIGEVTAVFRRGYTEDNDGLDLLWSRDTESLSYRRYDIGHNQRIRILEPEPDASAEEPPEESEPDYDVLFVRARPSLVCTGDSICLSIPPCTSVAECPFDFSIIQDGEEKSSGQMSVRDRNGSRESIALTVDLLTSGIDVLEPFSLKIGGRTVYENSRCDLLMFDSTGQATREPWGDTLAITHLMKGLTISGAYVEDEMVLGELHFVLLDVSPGGTVGTYDWDPEKDPLPVKEAPKQPGKKPGKEKKEQPERKPSRDITELDFEDFFGVKDDLDEEEADADYERGFLGYKPNLSFGDEAPRIFITKYIGHPGDDFECWAVQDGIESEHVELDRGIERGKVISDTYLLDLEGFDPLEPIELFIDGRSVHRTPHRDILFFDGDGYIASDLMGDRLVAVHDGREMFSVNSEIIDSVVLGRVRYIHCRISVGGGLWIKNPYDSEPFVPTGKPGKNVRRGFQGMRPRIRYADSDVILDVPRFLDKQGTEFVYTFFQDGKESEPARLDYILIGDHVGTIGTGIGLISEGVDPLKSYSLRINGEEVFSGGTSEYLFFGPDGSSVRRPKQDTVLVSYSRAEKLTGEAELTDERVVGKFSIQRYSVGEKGFIRVQPVKEEEPADVEPQASGQSDDPRNHTFVEGSPNMVYSDFRYVVEIPEYLGTDLDRFELSVMTKSRLIPLGRLETSRLAGLRVSQPVTIDLSENGISPYEGFAVSIDNEAVFTKPEEEVIFLDGDFRYVGQAEGSVNIMFRRGRYYTSGGIRLINRSVLGSNVLLNVRKVGPQEFSLLPEEEKEPAGKVRGFIRELPDVVLDGDRFYLNVPQYTAPRSDLFEAAVKSGDSIIPVMVLPAVSGASTVTGAVRIDITALGISPLQRFELLIDEHLVHVNWETSYMLFDSEGKHTMMPRGHGFIVAKAGSPVFMAGVGVLRETDVGDNLRISELSISEDAVFRYGKETWTDISERTGTHQKGAEAAISMPVMSMDMQSYLKNEPVPIYSEYPEVTVDVTGCSVSQCTLRVVNKRGGTVFGPVGLTDGFLQLRTVDAKGLLTVLVEAGEEAIGSAEYIMDPGFTYQVPTGHVLKPNERVRVILGSQYHAGSPYTDNVYGPFKVYGEKVRLRWRLPLVRTGFGDGMEPWRRKWCRLDDLPPKLQISIPRDRKAKLVFGCARKGYRMVTKGWKENEFSAGLGVYAEEMRAEPDKYGFFLTVDNLPGIYVLNVDSTPGAGDDRL